MEAFFAIVCAGVGTLALIFAVMMAFELRAASCPSKSDVVAAALSARDFAQYRGGTDLRIILAIFGVLLAISFFCFRYAGTYILALL